MWLCQHQNRASSPAKNSTPTDQPQRKPVGRWCLAGNVERLEVVGWQIGVVAVMRRWRSDGRNPLGTVDSGAWPCMQLYIMTHSLYATRSQVHRASVARCAGAATSHDKTCLCGCHRKPSSLLWNSHRWGEMPISRTSLPTSDSVVTMSQFKKPVVRRHCHETACSQRIRCIHASKTNGDKSD